MPGSDLSFVAPERAGLSGLPGEQGIEQTAGAHS